MSLAFPSFLWALTVLSVPILIHLFNFRRTKRVYFSNNRLLKQVKQETTQQRRLKQFLVLAARLLFLFFLVIAFAQPYRPAKEQIASGHQVVIYLDNSQSMASKVAEKLRALDDGIGRGREILNVFPAESKFKLITNDFAPFSNNFKTKSEIEDILSQLKLSPIARTFEEVKKRMDIENTSIDIFWISDFQQSTLGKLSSVDSLNQWHLVPISYGKAISNVFIDSVYRDNPFAISGEKNSITAKLRNFGTAAREEVVVKLIINAAQSASATANIEPNSYAQVVFDLPVGLRKFNAAKIVVNDFPISFDNEFYFNLNKGEKIKIVEIKNEQPTTSIEAVFGNKELFTIHSFLSTNINYSLIKEANLVVVNEITLVDNALQTTLREYQERGGLVLLIPASKPALSSYQFLVKSNPLLQMAKSEIQDMDKLDFQNPFFDNVFEDKATALTMPKGKKLIDWGNDPSALLKLKDGQPFLTQLGNTILLAAPLRNEFTDFHHHALFVPMMYRLAASGKKESQQLYYSLDNRFITIKSDSLPAEGEIKMMGDQEIVPTQRRNGDKVLLELPSHIINQGFYNIVMGRDTIDLIGLNLPKNESILKQFGGEEMKANLGGDTNISVLSAKDGSGFSSELKERYLGISLWKYAVVLAMLFLLAEVLLIRFLK